MAKAHNSKVVDARRKARDLAAAQQERHETLLALAEKYFVASDDADGVVSAARKAAARLISDAEVKSESKRHEAQKHIASMVGTGASVSDVASRLDVTAAVVRSAVKAATPTKKDESTTEGAKSSVQEHDSASV